MIMMIYRFDITPVPKPRMTVSDKWKNREIVTRYFAFRDVIRYKSNLQGLRGIPGIVNSLIFRLPMPESWSRKKKDLLHGRPHEQTPDLSNLLKAFEDCWSEDRHIHTFRNLQKVWASSGSIELQIEDMEEPTKLVEHGSGVHRSKTAYFNDR